MKRLVLFLLLCLSANLAHADCDATITPVTAKEKAFYSSKFPALRAALPKPPAGWQYDDDAKNKLAPGYKDYIPSQNCGPSIYYIGLGIDYERPMSQAEQDAEVAAMQAPPDPAKQKQLEAIMAKQQALIQQVMAASQKQDTKAMDALSKQSDALGNQMQALQQDMNSAGQAKVAAIEWDRKANVSIRVNDNAGDVTCYGSPKALPVPGAVAYQCWAPATYSSPGEVLDPARGRVVVVFGNASVKQYDWDRRDAHDKQIKDSYVQIKFDTNNDDSMRVHNVVLDVSGDDLARAQSLYSQIDVKPLAALMKP